MIAKGISLLDVNENKICKGPKFPFNYIRNMAVKPNGTFYVLNTETSKDQKPFDKIDKFTEEKIKKHNQMESTNKNFYEKNNKISNDLMLEKKNESSNIIGEIENFKINNIEIKENFNKTMDHNKNKLDSQKQEFSKTNNINSNNKAEINNSKSIYPIIITDNPQISQVEKLKNKSNLDRFKNIISENNKNRIILDNSSLKRIKTAGDYQPKRSDLEFNKNINNKNTFEIQNNCGKEYERIIKTSHDQRRLGNEFIPNTRLINQKMLESDIFFFSNKVEDKSNLYHSRNVKSKSGNLIPDSKQNYLESDVFNFSNNEASQKKIGEKYLFNDNKYKKIGYHPSAKSNSEWSPKNYVKSYMNYNSCDYDLFNPYMKKTVFTKEKIKESSGINPIHRQKCITEFVDLTRNFVPNYNRDFVNAINKEERIFSKTRDLCGNLLELHKEYYNICTKPFKKKDL